CHCDSDPDLSFKSRLGFRGEFPVTIGDLRGYFHELARKSERRAGTGRAARRPLVFLNACRGAQVRPGAITSFPHFFLHPKKGCGSRGVIGTEANVPDYFAAAFSELFYLYLLSGDNLGEAIFNTKRHLLREQVNPLGILYTIYAYPNIRVQLPNRKLAP